MKKLFTRKVLLIGALIVGIIGVPLTLIQLQQQQELRQHAWFTSQSASASCPAQGEGIEIIAVFSNTEPKKSSTAMNVIATDQQTGKSVNMGSIAGGEAKTSKIVTTNTTLASGLVVFKLTWTDGHSGTDTRTATYNKVTTCVSPSSSPTPTLSVTPSVSPSPSITPPDDTPTPTPINSPTPSLTPPPTPTVSISVTPTICPTLGPVQNVKIDCPNCH